MFGQNLGNTCFNTFRGQDWRTKGGRLGIENCNLLKTLKEIRYLFLDQRLDILHSERLGSHLHSRLRGGWQREVLKPSQGSARWSVCKYISRPLSFNLRSKQNKKKLRANRQVISVQIALPLTFNWKSRPKKHQKVKPRNWLSFENRPKSVVHYSVSWVPRVPPKKILGQCRKVPRVSKRQRKQDRS